MTKEVKIMKFWNSKKSPYQCYKKLNKIYIELSQIDGDNTLI